MLPIFAQMYIVRSPISRPSMKAVNAGFGVNTKSNVVTVPDVVEPVMFIVHAAPNSLNCDENAEP